MTIKHNKGFFILMLLLGAASLYILRSYIGMFLLALVMVVVFEPLYERLLKKIKRPGIASLITTFIVVFAIILPLFLAVTLAVDQALGFVKSVQTQKFLEDESVKKVVTLGQSIWVKNEAEIVATFEELDIDFGKVAQNIWSKLAGVLSNNIVPAITQTAKLVIDFIIFIIVMIYLFPVKKSMFIKLGEIAPVKGGVYKKFVSRFEKVTKGTIKGTIMIALVQGLLGGIMLFILGVEGAAFWGMLMAVASLIPLGAGLIYWPMGIILILTGQWVQGIILLLWGNFVISSADNVIRPKILGGDEGMPEIVTLLSVLGGVQVFGFTGFIFGPLILGLFLTSLQIYKSELRH